MNPLDILFPKRCVGCGRLGAYFCTDCRKRIRSVDTPICPVCEKPAIDGATHPRCKTRYAVDGLTSFFRYDGVIKKAIKSVKYRFVSDVCAEFVNLIPSSSLLDLTKQLDSNPLSSFIVPIPLHAARLRFRGFNQAEKLGSVLAKRLHIPIQTGILQRTKETKPQVEMKDREERLNNMAHVFSISSIRISNYPAILLFDDVFTTGATMRAAANLLKRSGIQRVWGVTMAR